jgi:hypothetical protein
LTSACRVGELKHWSKQITWRAEKYFHKTVCKHLHFPWKVDISFAFLSCTYIHTYRCVCRRKVFLRSLLICLFVWHPSRKTNWILQMPPYIFEVLGMEIFGINILKPFGVFYYHLLYFALIWFLFIVVRQNDILSNDVFSNDFLSKNAKTMFCLTTFGLSTFLSNDILV